MFLQRTVRAVSKTPDKPILDTTFLLLLLFLLFICAYNVWVISPPFPLPSSFPPFPPSPSLPHRYQAETILPLSLILLKREYKQ
jgi:hypothetical protein